MINSTNSPRPLNNLTPIFQSFILKSGSDPKPGLNSSLNPPTLFQVFFFFRELNDGCQCVP